MLDTNVRVHPSFWIVSALLGWSWFNSNGISYLLLWILCVFISILVHEFGHVLMGRLFGSRGHIVLYSFGGLAIGSNMRSGWRSILVLLAGPGAQFLLLGVVILIDFLMHPNDPGLEGFQRPIQRSPLEIMLSMLLWINLFWPIFNLLPIWPLDGGQIAREVCQMIWKQNGVSYSLLLSGVLSGVLALHCLMAEMHKPLIPFLWMIGGLYMGFFFAMFAIQSFQAWQIESNRESRRRHDRLPWE